MYFQESHLLDVGKELPKTNLSKQLFVEASRNLGEEKPFGQRLRRALINISLGLVIPFHQMYAKYLVASMLNRIAKTRQ